MTGRRDPRNRPGGQDGRLHTTPVAVLTVVAAILGLAFIYMFTVDCSGSEGAFLVLAGASWIAILVVVRLLWGKS